MKKEENQKRNIALKNEYISRSRSHSPKAYLGCDTCKLRKAKSNSRLSDCVVAQDKIKLRKSPNSGKDERRLKNQKIKIVDLCDDDKKRLVELIEELSNLAEKNDELKEKLDQMHKSEQEQKDYILKQANLFLEEKNFYVNEINEYKNRLEILENEMRNKISQWKNHGRCKDSEIAYLARALQKSLQEKTELHDQMNHLKISLKHSLESFQKLRDEVTNLQYKEQQIRKYKSTYCQTEALTSVSREKHKFFEEDTEDEEFLSTYNQDSLNAKSSLDVINDKLENVYQLLKKRRETLPNTPTKKCDTDLSVQLKNDRLAKERRLEDDNQKTENRIPPGTPNSSSPDDELKADYEENEYKFLKLFDVCNKSSVQAERMQRKMEKPLQINVNEYTQTIENNNMSTFKSKEVSQDGRNLNFLQNKIVQKNNFFKSSESHQYDEDRLLEELFYSDQTTHLGLDSRLEAKKMKKTSTDTPIPF